MCNNDLGLTEKNAGCTCNSHPVGNHETMRPQRMP